MGLTGRFRPDQTLAGDDDAVSTELRRGISNVRFSGGNYLGSSAPFGGPLAL